MLGTKFRQFGVLHNLLGIMDSGSTAYAIGTYPPNRQIPEYSPLLRDDTPADIKVSTLPNGVRILTETAKYPTSVYMGAMLDAGTRDETMDTAGVMLALKNTFLKTNERTNEQINYCMIQMSGGEFSMDYTQERTSYGGYCLSHDVYDFAQMMSDCLLDDKTVMDEEAATWWADEYFKLRDENITNAGRIDELFLTLAYGQTGLGMPLPGFHSKYQNIGYSHMNAFRRDVITPDRMVLVGGGVYNHDEFVDTLTPYFQFLNAKSPAPRAKSAYLGGEIRELTESANTHVHLSFQGPSWSSPDLGAATILKTIISDAGQGALDKFNSSRAQSVFMAKYPYLLSVKTHFKVFSDSGNFGVTLAGPSSKAGEISDALTKELQDLANVKDDEVNRAKNVIKTKFLIQNADTRSRMGTIARSVLDFGAPKSEADMLAILDKTTPDQVRKFAKNVLKSKPTLIVLGGETHQVPSVDTFASRFK